MKLEALELPLNVIDSGFNAAIGVAAAGVTALVGAMGAAIKTTFDWAGELDSIQDIIGGTNEEAAALNFTLRKSGTSTETFNKSMTILNKGLVKADGSLDTIGKGLASWGIDVKGANGQLKTQQQLLTEVSKKYNEFGTQQERVNFLTETFGRGGAEMIDFFDTLAAEGGIDAVTDKVQRLGLVIDPARYEQFTRSLEELKLIGLGLAVGFTEKVMPALERFLEIVTGDGTIGEKLGILVSEFDTFVGNAMNNMAIAIENWASGSGPQELSDKLVAWIENVGKGEGFDSKILQAAQRIAVALGDAFEKVDWDAIGQSLDIRLTDEFNKSETAIDEWWATTAKDGVMRAHEAFTAWGQATGQAMLASLGEAFSTAGNAVMGFFNNWERTWTNAIRNWGVSVYNQIITWINQINAAINSVVPGGAGLNMLPQKTTYTGVNSGRGGRASGGPVIAGQTYDVTEFYRPERFTPAVNGRIDPIQNAAPAEIDYERLADAIGLRFELAIQKL